MQIACCKCFIGLLILRQLILGFSHSHQVLYFSPSPPLSLLVLVLVDGICVTPSCLDRFPASLESGLALSLLVLDQLVDGGELGQLTLRSDQLCLEQQIGVGLRDLVGLWLFQQRHIAVVHVSLDGQLVYLFFDGADDAAAVKGLEG